MLRSTAQSNGEPDRPRRRLLPARTWSAAAGFAVLAIVAACSSEPGDVPLYSEPEYDGLSREEIESRAEAMTPAEAELLGIVDTTIRIEAPMNPDSVLPLPVDTLVRP